jgi:hypothetical protein
VVAMRAHHGARPVAAVLARRHRPNGPHGGVGAPVSFCEFIFFLILLI